MKQEQKYFNQIEMINKGEASSDSSLESNPIVTEEEQL